MYYDYLESPIGTLLLVGNGHDSGNALKQIEFPKKGRRTKPLSAWDRDPRPLREVSRQLKAYFAGQLTRFDLELSPEGTGFQRRVWTALQTIPYGKTISYKELAEKIGNPKAVRAVGGANGRNPIPIVIPCHRVIGADGLLTGFGGGVDVKYALLSLEIGRDYNLRSSRRLQPKQRVMF